MDYSQSPSSISPNSHDYQELDSMYGHVDSYNSYSTSSGSGPKGKGVASDEGHPVGVPPGALRVKKNKFEEEWVMADGNGGYWVFHVRLAPAGAK